MTEERSSRQRLAADVARTLDLDQHADALVGAVMGLLARRELLEDRLAYRPALVQLGGAEEAQKARVEHAVALRLEVRVDHGDTFVVAEIVQRLLLGALPVGQ